MDVRLWISLSAGGDEFVNKFVVLFATDARFAQAQVQVIIKKLLVLASR